MKAASGVLALLLVLLLLSVTSPSAGAQDLVVSPEAGLVGTPVRLSGSGFTAGNTFSVFFGGVPVAEGTVGAGGRLPRDTIFYVPWNSPGGYWVEVADGFMSASRFFELRASPSVDLSLSPAAGQVGARVTVRASGLEKGVKVTLHYDGRVVGSSRPLSGELTAFFDVPTGPGGERIVNLLVNNEVVAAATYQVKPSLTLAETLSGDEGTRLILEGRGFVAGEPALAIYLGPHGIGRVASNESGTFSSEITVVGVPAGAWDLRIVDSSGNILVSLEQFTIEASIHLSSVLGQVGREVSIIGASFAPNKAIELSYDGTPLVLTSPLETDARGQFEGRFSVPGSQAGGHTIVASDGRNTASVLWTVENTPPATPVPVTPLSGARVAHLSVEVSTFTWTKVTDPSGVSYAFGIAGDQNFTIPVLEKMGLTSNVYNLAEAEISGPGRYYWRVKAVDGAGNGSPWSPVRSFEVSRGVNWWLVLGVVFGLWLFIRLAVWMVVRGRRWER